MTLQYQDTCITGYRSFSKSLRFPWSIVSGSQV